MLSFFCPTAWILYTESVFLCCKFKANYVFTWFFFLNTTNYNAIIFPVELFVLIYIVDGSGSECVLSFLHSQRSSERPCIITNNNEFNLMELFFVPIVWFFLIQFSNYAINIFGKKGTQEIARSFAESFFFCVCPFKFSVLRRQTARLKINFSYKFRKYIHSWLFYLFLFIFICILLLLYALAYLEIFSNLNGFLSLECLPMLRHRPNECCHRL